MNTELREREIKSTGSVYCLGCCTEIFNYSRAEHNIHYTLSWGQFAIHQDGNGNELWIFLNDCASSKLPWVKEAVELSLFRDQLSLVGSYVPLFTTLYSTVPSTKVGGNCFPPISAESLIFLHLAPTLQLKTRFHILSCIPTVKLPKCIQCYWPIETF